METFKNIDEAKTSYIHKYHCLSKDEENLRYFKVVVALQFLQDVKWRGIIPAKEEDILRLHTNLTDCGVYRSYQGYGWNGHGGKGALWKLEESQLTEEDYKALKESLAS